MNSKKKYEQDFYIITHSQGSSWYVISQLIKILVRQYDKNIIVPPDFEFLRSTKLKPNNTSLGYRQELATGSVDDHNNEIRGSLVSSDVYFFSTSQDESVLDLLTQDYSIMSLFNPNAIRDISETILHDYLPPTINAKKITELAEQIQNLSKKINSLVGQLFVICIPKTTFASDLDNIGFLAHPKGKPCTCHPLANAISIIDKLQNGDLNSQTCCYQTSYIPPQFRLMASKVAPNLGVKSFLLNAIPEKQKADIYTEISKAVATLA